MCPAFPYTLGEHDIADRFFSPPGRRWSEGSDEGASSPDISTLAPSSRCRGLLPPRGEEICRTRSLHISLVIGSMSSPIISFLTTTAPRLIEINSLST